MVVLPCASPLNSSKIWTPSNPRCLAAGPCAACPAAQWRRSSPTCMPTAARCATSAPNAPNLLPMSFPPAAEAWTSSTTPPRRKSELPLPLKDRDCSTTPTLRHVPNHNLSITLHHSNAHIATLSFLPRPTPNSRASYGNSFAVVSPDRQQHKVTSCLYTHALKM